MDTSQRFNKKNVFTIKNPDYMTERCQLSLFDHSYLTRELTRQHNKFLNWVEFIIANLEVGEKHIIMRTISLSRVLKTRTWRSCSVHCHTLRSRNPRKDVVVWIRSKFTFFSTKPLRSEHIFRIIFGSFYKVSIIQNCVCHLKYGRSSMKLIGRNIGSSIISLA